VFTEDVGLDVHQHQTIEIVEFLRCHGDHVDAESFQQSPILGTPHLAE
jgi:hypothetical protein